MLKRVAQVIKETIRDIDIPARYGGERFAVVLPGTSGEGARNIAGRLRRRVKENPFSADGRQIDVSISAGIAASLSGAKSIGRDQSALWSYIS